MRVVVDLSRLEATLPIGLFLGVSCRQSNSKLQPPSGSGARRRLGTTVDTASWRNGCIPVRRVWTGQVAAEENRCLTLREMSSGGGVIDGPWRATRLWNDVVRTFHTGMPVKKHWRHMKAFDDSFTGAEAVAWLHKHLKKNPNFGSDVTKEQTVQLLQKLLKAEVMQAIGASESTGLVTNVSEFSTAGLYRMVESATESLRTPGKKSPGRLGGHGRRTPFSNLGNVTQRRLDAAEDQWDTKSEPGGVGDQDGKTKRTKSAEKCSANTRERHALNRSYFQSLPPNSLILLDNEDTWRRSFIELLNASLSEAHVKSLDINVSYIMHNMSKGKIVLRSGDNIS